MKFRLIEKRQHNTEGVTRIVIISDEEAIGSSSVSDDGKIVLKVPDFLMEGKEVCEKEVINAITSADVVLLYGDKAINLAIDLGFVTKDSVLDVKGLKHVQIIKFLY